MNKKEEFCQRLALQLTRFNIQDKFNQIDSRIARISIANAAYNILEQMVTEAKNNVETKEEEKNENQDNNP